MSAFGPLEVAVIVFAVAIDALFGEVPNRVHPVVGMGNLTHWLLRKSPLHPAAQLLFGAALVLTVTGASLAVASVATCLLEQLDSHLIALAAQTPVLAHGKTHIPRIAIEGLLLSTLFAGRGLLAAGVRMRQALSFSLSAGRAALCHLCSRDASTLDEADLCGATVESLSENSSDSFVAPLFWYVLVSICGAPGLYGAAFYRAVNTLDAMVGYRGKYEYIGKTAARLDDVLNWVPARLTAGLLLLSAVIGALPFGFSPLQGIRILWRDRALTESPNAGWPMAATAGALGIELVKRDHYTLGAGFARPTPPAIAACERLVFIALATGLLLLVTYGVVRGNHA